MPEAAPWAGEWPTATALVERARAVLDLSLSSGDAERLLDFVRLLERWAAKFNLVAAASRAEIVDRHLLDSLAVLRVLGAAPSLADFGSGAGFPGVPLAILRPDMQVVLVESRAHRANFLRQAVRTLGLHNAEVFDDRGDAFTAGTVALVVSRAVHLDQVVVFARRALAPGSRLVAMTKAPAEEREIEGFRRLRRVAYRLPHGHTHELLELERIC